MGKVEFTKEQQAAVYGVGNTIVSAGAGSGKTAVMIERITEKLKAGKSLENMLIVTFTRAAAADIKVKLVEKLKDLRKTHPAAAQAALEALPVSDIGTLHGFCQRLIKTYFYAAGVDPSAVVCEDGEAKIYKRA
ncbi:MAG: UvrD-helicase domain-containing protein, partial [Clostridia bacterium]|nr:UvrD-helicase domain-containing protein [Clostridia bacterium]